MIIKSNFVRSYSKAAFLLGIVSKLGKHNFPDFSLRLSTVFKGVSVHIFDIFSSSITFHRVPPFLKKAKCSLQNPIIFCRTDKTGEKNLYVDYLFSRKISD